MQLIRFSQFMALGYANFGHRGYEARSRHFTPNALDKDLRGQHYIITGSSSGLGLATAQALAFRGGSVHLVCRGAAKGQSVVDAINGSGGDAHLHICDMSNLSEVTRFAESWRAEERPIAALINNAGTMVHEKLTSADGLELNFATNTLATFVLTELLRPVLKSGARVVTVSSGGMYNAGLEIEDLDGYDLSTGDKIDGTMQYARNKRQQVALNEYWASRYADSGIFWACMHPGWAITPGVEKSMPGFYQAMRNQMRSTEEGADTIVWLSIAEEVVKFKSGDFFFDRNAASKHLWGACTQYAEDKPDELAKKLRAIAAEKGVVLPEE